MNIPELFVYVPAVSTLMNGWAENRNLFTELKDKTNILNVFIYGKNGFLTIGTLFQTTYFRLDMEKKCYLFAITLRVARKQNEKCVELYNVTRFLDLV